MIRSVEMFTEWKKVREDIGAKEKKFQAQFESTRRKNEVAGLIRDRTEAYEKIHAEFFLD